MRRRTDIKQEKGSYRSNALKDIIQATQKTKSKARDQKQTSVLINDKMPVYCRDDFPFIALTQRFITWAV